MSTEKDQRQANGQTKEQSLKIPLLSVVLDGDLSIPERATGLVVFAHGSGSGRHSPRNRHVAQQLQARGLATLLFDLLTSEEERHDDRTGAYRFDVPLLGRRMVEVTSFIKSTPVIKKLNIGYFGASTGAAAALVAAAEVPDGVKAMVSRGGRPDLAGQALSRVKAPTLLIVGGHDTAVIAMNREALGRLTVEKEMVIVPGATHLFEEPGTLEQVSVLAGDWFTKYL
jgi:putative phosphoribosyl transferase